MFTSIGEQLATSSRFNDKRLSKRFGNIVTTISDNYGHSLPQSMGNKHQTKATYNFMNNEKVTVEGLYSSESSRLKEQLLPLEGQTYLAISDTSSLNFTTNKSSKQLDCLDSLKQKGYFMHTLAFFDAKGCPEGLLRSFFYNRKPEDLHKSSRTKSADLSKQPIEEKESYRWLEDLNTLHSLFGTLTQHRFIHVMDREGDIFEVFSARCYDHIHILTRVNHDRKIIGSSDTIKSHVQKTRSLGQIEITIRDTPKQGEDADKDAKKVSKVKRTAVLEVRCTPVKVTVPKDLKVYQKDKAYKPLDLYVVHTKEIVPQGQLSEEFEPLEWYLITSIPVETLEQAIEVIEFYAIRWRIEDFHLVLKEGAKVENFQYQDTPQLKNALVVYAIAALQVLRLRYLGETQGDKPMEILGYSHHAFDVIATYLIKVKKVKVSIPTQPTVKEFLNLITILGSGNPKAIGVRALWRGLRDFNIIYQTFCMINNESS